MATRMQQRKGTAEQWTTVDPVLAPGEIGWESDTNSFKIGDGLNSWSLLPYFLDESSLVGSLEDYVPVTSIGAADGVASLDENGQVPASQLQNATVDLTGYATESYVDQAELDAVSTANAYTDSEIAAIPAVDLTGYATETYVDTAIENIVGLAPEDLNTLAELADALGDNPAAITTLQSDVTALQTDKADTNSPTFTGLTDFQGIVDFSDAVLVGIDALPDQTGNDGKYLTTDGNTASWQTVASPVPHPFTMIG